ncbi:MAG: hypothetical protein LBP78_05440 [Acidaminococcales bacterium]|jgi:peptidoglycan/xylan/chitin deacetylase (PgdA/CDA1 family)|nr:hypothetical protein [Acidaminococcales bacterium]
MKKRLLGLVLIFLVVAAVHFLPIVYTRWLWSQDREMTALLLYNENNLKAAAYVAEAYTSVLEEEGVPLRAADVNEVIRLKAAELAGRIPALILPDGILQTTPEGLAGWVDEYLSAGGNVAVVYDVGVKNFRGNFLERAELADIIGLNYIMPAVYGKHPYASAKIQFAAKTDWDFFQCTPGRDIPDLTLSGIGGDAAKYHAAYNEVIREPVLEDVRAWAITDAGEKLPALVLSDYKKGKVLYVNLPLGNLKANADDMPLRSVMRTFLFDVAALPHLINVEDGVGGLVLNMRFFLRMSEEDLATHMARGFLNEKVPVSLHIAAADYLDTPGDDTGFDAAGYGREQVEVLSRYGRIGSLGGMANNWFAGKVESATFGAAEIKENIAANNKILEEITGYKITEYSSPAGVHPQPVMTRALEELGMTGYAYIYEFSAAPNRTFVNRRRASDKAIAFPLLAYHRYPSLWELYLVAGNSGDATEEKLDLWLQEELLPYLARHKTVRTLMVNEQHMYAFSTALKNLVDYLADASGEGRAAALTMSGYADFLLRFLKTEYTFTQNGGGLSLDLKNPETLRGIVLALPKAKYGQPADAGLIVSEDEKWYYVKADDPDAKEKIINIPAN